MEGLILLALIIALLIIVSPILSLIAMSRSRYSKESVDRLIKRVKALEQQIEQLTSSLDIGKRKSTPEPLTPPQRKQSQVDLDIVSPVAESQPKPQIDSALATAAEQKAADDVEHPSREQPAAASPNVTAIASTPVQSSELPPKIPSINTESSPPQRDKPLPVRAKTQSVENDNVELPGMIASLIGWFFRGNPLAKLGVILLFFGLVYLMKYSIEQNMFSIELRLISAALISFTLLGFGWKLRLKQPLYALILQGGAIGALYLTVFGAFRLYDLLPQPLAFGLMIAVCVLSVGLAVLQNALSLSMLASLGGYLSPILLSTGGGSHVGLFSYYLMISLGILAVSVWQSWRVLNLLGFFFTFGVAILWGMQNYQPEYYFSCQLFLIANVLIFGVFSIGLSLRQQIKGKEVIDGVLLFGPPLLGFGMQYGITAHWPFGPAFSALGFGIVYLILALASLRRYPAIGSQMATSGLALGLAFVTLAIPLALSAQWTAIAWTLEGLGILWVGLNQAQRKMAWSGSAIVALGLISALIAFADNYRTDFAVVLVLGIVIAGQLASAALWNRHRLAGSFDAQFSLGFTVVGILIWMHWIWRIQDLVLSHVEVNWLLTVPQSISILLMSLSVILWRYIGLKLNWQQIRTAVWVLWPFLLMIELTHYANFGLYGLERQWLWLACWSIATAVGYWLLKHEEQFIPMEQIKQGLHLFLFWSLMLAIIHLAFTVAERSYYRYWGMDEWIIGLFNAFIAVLILAVGRVVNQPKAAVYHHRRLYLSIGLTPMIGLLLLVTVTLITMDGVMIGWRYLPLISPLDESVLFALLTIACWIHWRPYPQQPFSRYGYRILALILFVWINALILRTLSYYGEIHWQIDSLWQSRLVQTVFALFWTLIALVCMVWANRYRRRAVWLTGAGLLGVTILKLFIVDSARGGGLARAIAFIGVAVLILIIGYFAPLPPKEHGKNNQDLSV
jgi:uncharacterized membrane protein